MKEQTVQEMQEENELIRRAASAHKDQLALSKLLVKYQPLIMAASHDWQYRELGEEAQAIAQLYFLDAVNTFDTERGVPFAAYVKSHVYGGLKTFWLAELRRRARELKPDGMEDESGSGEENEAGVWDAIFLAAKGISPSGSAEMSGLGRHMDGYEQVDFRSEVEEALRALTQREREVVREIYFRDCPAHAAARKLKLSESRVSRLKNSALVKMRRVMKP